MSDTQTILQPLLGTVTLAQISEGDCTANLIRRADGSEHLTLSVDLNDGVSSLGMAKCTTVQTKPPTHLDESTR